MEVKMKRLTIVLVLGMVLGQGAYGNNAGEKAAAFLKLGQGARANGMAGAYSAIADDSSIANKRVRFNYC